MQKSPKEQGEVVEENETEEVPEELEEDDADEFQDAVEQDAGNSGRLGQNFVSGTRYVFSWTNWINLGN